MATVERPATATTSRDERPVTRAELREEVRHELRHYATKADLAQMEARLTRWMVGMMFGGMAAAAAIASFVAVLLGN